MERLLGIDLGAHFFFQSLRRPWLDPVVAGLTHLGDSLVLGTIAALATLAFLAARQYRAALAIALSGFLALGLSESVKHLVHRERPPDVRQPVVRRPKTPSFPSGHALGSAAVYGAIGLAAARSLRSRRARRAAITAGFFLAFLIGLTRLYLGVHFLFDVVGGWLAGVACALLGHWLDLTLRARADARTQGGPRTGLAFDGGAEGCSRRL